MYSEETIDNLPATDEATLLFRQLEEVATAKFTIRDKYTLLRDVFRQAVNRAVGSSTINFIGLFAKVDYLVKKNNIPTNTAFLIHDTRRILNDVYSATENDLTASFLHDIKATALLVKYIYANAVVPPSLEKLFPTDNRKRRWNKFDVNHLRCIVSSWDDQYIYATEEQNNSKLKICYSSQNQYLSLNGKSDWSYLRQILHTDAQINLVRIRMEEDVCLPELIIYEPDYLIDITTIASCFESYAESPYVNIINRLKPQPNTMHIHLGNLAGQFLDDTVHGRHKLFEESVNEFFRKNVVSMVSCSDFQDAHNVERFYNDARQQQLNINSLIGEELPREIGEYDAHSAVLEPTFFSEVLGVQGRLDLLHEKDGNITIIEQKSGKGAFVPGANNPNRPEPQEKHLVQLSLYRALFNYEFNKHAEQMRHFLLLYSRYKEGLVSIANLPQLTLRAIRMRNLLAWCDIWYANNELKILETINADTLNRKHLTGRLWEEWVRPGLEQILKPIHEATPLERAYYLRFLEFIGKEHLLSKIGNKTKDDSGFAAIWLDTIEDKRSAGSIYEQLAIESFGQNGDSVESISLLFPTTQSADTSNFRRGDIVILYPYRKDGKPNACAQMVIRASISNITAENVEVVLRNPQTDRKIFDAYTDSWWAIEHDMFESSVKSLYSSMQLFLSAPKERRDLLLCQREPKIDSSIKINGDYGTFNSLVEHARQARDLFLVIGPPGTGKTSFALLNILKEELTVPKTNVLLLSYTNRAVDEICSKLVGSGIDFIRIGTELSCDEAYRQFLLSNRASECCNTKAATDLLNKTRVFCSTTAALNANIHLLNIKHFDLAIIDESSQILEPHLIGLLSVLDSIRRFILIGDHKQLPAVVQQTAEESKVDNPMLNAIKLTNCRNSLFQRLLACFRTAEDYDRRYVYMLTRQGRMHQEIAEFPNIAFYDDKLTVVPLPHQVKHDDAESRVTFIASPTIHSAAPMKTNQAEADIIANVVMQIYNITGNTFDPAQTVGIIVPYRNQIATVRKAINEAVSREANKKHYDSQKKLDIIQLLTAISIDTVERYQGSQRDFIIYGFTVRQPYQLDFLASNDFEENGMLIDPKLNVAMTRARLKLIMVGNPDIICRDTVFKHLLDFLKSKNAYYEDHMPVIKV